jgi:hypothetical protein
MSYVTSALGLCSSAPSASQRVTSAWAARLQSSGAWASSRRPSTLWIASRGGQVSLVRLKNLLLIPRRDDFYWVSVNPGEPPDVRPFGVEPPGNVKRARPAEPPADEQEDEYGCTPESSWWRIEFVNDRLLALSRQWASSCHGRSNNSYQVRVLRDTVSAAKPYGAPVPPSGALEQFDEAKLRQAAIGHFQLSGATLAPEDDDIDPLSWTIQRGFGRWQARGAYITRGNISSRLDFDLPADFLPDLARNPPLRPGWDVILASVPDALDAFTSPTGGLVVVLTRDRVLAYVPIDGRLGRPALRWATSNPNRSSAAMVEWATGRNVPRWDAIVHDAAKRLRKR